MNNDKVKKQKVEKVRKPKKPKLLNVEHFDYSIDNYFKFGEYVDKLQKNQNISEENKKKLRYIAIEILHSNQRMIREQIFYIGELLYQAKRILKSEKINFKQWVESNFDFGYHTALNFCNVYIACLGKFVLIRCIKTSILYGISAPAFPKELRNYLIFNNLIDGITNDNLKIIYNEYKEKGFRHVQKKLEQKASIPLSLQDSIPYIDNLFMALFLLEKKKNKLEHRLHLNEDIAKRKGITDKGDNIIYSILESINKSILILKEAKENIYSKIDELNSLQLKNLDNGIE